MADLVLPQPGDLALTVKQPWADLIMAGVKDVENRTWPVPSTLPQHGRCSDCGLRMPEPMNTGSCPSCDNFRGHMNPDGPFPFRLWIHAGQRYDDAAPQWVEDEREALAWREPDPWSICRFGLLLGSVEVTGCHWVDGRSCHEDGHDGGMCSRWAQRNSFHWKLTDPQPLAEPIPAKGALGLWRIPEGLVAA